MAICIDCCMSRFCKNMDITTDCTDVADMFTKAGVNLVGWTNVIEYREEVLRFIVLTQQHQ